MSRLLINEPPLQVLPSLAVKVGLQEAIVLQQVHYWLQATKPRDGSRRWVFNTYEQWAEQFPFWSPEAIRKIFKSLRNQGLIVSRPRGLHAFDRVNEYTIDYDVLEGLHPEESTGSAGANRPVHPEKFTASERTNLPTTRAETSTETTAERAARKRAAPASRMTAQDLKAEGVDESYAEAWLAIRREKRLPLTAGAWELTKAGGAAHGLSPAETVRECVSRGWAAFREDWYGKGAASRPMPPQTRQADLSRVSGLLGFDIDADPIEVEARHAAR